MILTGKIVDIMASGVMLQIRPYMEPMLCPTAILSIRLVSHPSALALQMGQEIRVKYKGRDPETGIIGDAKKSEYYFIILQINHS